MRPVRLTVSSSLTNWYSPKSTTPTLSSSRFKARPRTSCGNSRSSPAITFSSPCTSAMPSPILMTVPTSVTVTPASKFSICCRMISLISLALIGSLLFK